MFANVGDGTYFHSGSMAIRQAIAAGIDLTYKILYNGAVAMTGGQPVNGTLTVPQVAAQLRAEGVARVAVVSATPERLRAEAFLPGTPLVRRDKLDRAQRELRTVPGVTAIIYEQTCATEPLRRRKRGNLPDPNVRAFINDRACDGCGDCGVQSKCLSIQPLETECGRKRTIDQSACNKDRSCLKGFCRSFVPVKGAKVRKRAASALDVATIPLPNPAIASLRDGLHGTLLTGIGGMGVVTVAALLTAAARSSGFRVQSLDFTGLAQKFASVYCHVKVVSEGSLLRTTRLSDGHADTLYG